MLPIIAVDFDGVIASWDSGTFWEPGQPIDGARTFLEGLAKIGRVMIYTCRCNSELYDGRNVNQLSQIVWDWLRQQGMVHFVDSVYIGQGKPYAACYIDDKAIHCDPESMRQESALSTVLVKAEAMCCNGRQHPSKGGRDG